MLELPKEESYQIALSFEFGWPLFSAILFVFLINLLMCRWLTKIMLTNKVISKGNVVYDKVLLMWWFPIVGMFSLVLLMNVHDAIILWKRFKRWLFLTNH